MSRGGLWLGTTLLSLSHLFVTGAAQPYQGAGGGGVPSCLSSYLPSAHMTESPPLRVIAVRANGGQAGDGE